MWKFIKYEINYWLKSPMLWIFFLISTLLVFGAVSTDNVQLGGDFGSIHKNAPFVIQNYYGIMSLICLLMTTAFMNATANRDFDCNMYQFIFSSPIKKRDYYFGKFFGAVIVSIIPLLGVSVGILIAPFMPWVEPLRYGPVIWSGHLHGLISFGIPNVIIAGVLLYTLAIIFRSNIVSFIGAMLILVFYSISSTFTKDIEKEWLANILDPFGFKPLEILSKYLTVAEKNTQAVPLSGSFLFNRLLWVGISFAILLASYFKFSFHTKKEKIKKEKNNIENETKLIVSNTSYQPKFANKFSFKLLWYLVKFETKAIIKNPTFIIIVIIGLINLTSQLINYSGRYGIVQYPITYKMIDYIRGSFYLFLVAIITFYTGVLVWKERDSKINEIQDSSPIKSGLLFTSKLIALLAVIELVMILSVVIVVLAQTAYGYHHYQIDVFIKSLLILDFLSFAYLIIASLFFHYLINNRYIAYFAFITFVILNNFIWQLFEISSNMLKFGSTPSIIYSDMNGYGPFAISATWFNIYWFLASIIIGFVIFAFNIRGKEINFKTRLKNAQIILNKNKLSITAFLTLFLLCAAYVFYNTQILNKYDSSDARERKQVDYEKTYKKFEGIIQPRYYNLDYKIDLMPYQRSMVVHVDAWAKNTSKEKINELYLNTGLISDSFKISIENSTIKLNDKKLNFRIYNLKKPLNYNDSILIKLDIWQITKGFENEVSITQITQNGTFFTSSEILPSFGYDRNLEISDKNKRVKLKLPERNRSPKLDNNNFKARANTYVINDADWVEVNTTISTSPDQIAIAPGSLIKSWQENGKNYFNYKLDHKSLNFYSFSSARYEVAKEKWNDIDLEVYFTKEHYYNVPNMINSMKKSLSYYIKNFGPYYHKQCRVVEFPRYSTYAQAFPGTIPFSEGIGFIADLREVTKDDIDLVFYVVAHEIGHQYWAHQVCGAYMQGTEMLSESFSQYSALMVMEKEFGKDKMKKFLKYEMDSYLKGRSSELEAERPLMRTEAQGYIHYQKGSVIMYYFKEMIGEENVNKALKSLIDTFAYKQPPYPTSLDAIRVFKQSTPDSLQYLIADLFENITLFSNRMLEAKYKKVGNEYEVTIKTTSEKFIADSLGREKPMPIADFIDIGVFAKPIGELNLGKTLYLKRLKITQKENSFTFKTGEKPYQAGIDPFNYIIDRIPDDNVKKVEEL